ncbi:uncharacterized protein LOC118478525 [Aplysia californica]|uniref:Uncharacterized protein LOC118478525 n=1 Tax=Aplysia californica TaxID=6500 RepID=A0ABM1W0L0_APLCA|nr:uncharacterized protein LOC118478525 [Aplysia californica]
MERNGEGQGRGETEVVKHEQDFVSDSIGLQISTEMDPSVVRTEQNVFSTGGEGFVDGGGGEGFVDGASGAEAAPSHEQRWRSGDVESLSNGLDSERTFGNFKETAAVNGVEKRLVIIDEKPSVIAEEKLSHTISEKHSFPDAEKPVIQNEKSSDRVFAASAFEDTSSSCGDHVHPVSSSHSAVIDVPTVGKIENMDDGNKDGAADVDPEITVPSSTGGREKKRRGGGAGRGRGRGDKWPGGKAQGGSSQDPEKTF